MWGTTPPWLMTTSPRSLFNLWPVNTRLMKHHVQYVLLVVTDSELQVTGHDTLLLVITSRVASKLENLGSKVLEDGREVDYLTNESPCAPFECDVTYQEHQHQHAGRSCPSSTDGGHDPRGTGDQPWPSETATCRPHHQPFRTRTCHCTAKREPMSALQLEHAKEDRFVRLSLARLCISSVFMSFLHANGVCVPSLSVRVV